MSADIKSEKEIQNGLSPSALRPCLTTTLENMDQTLRRRETADAISCTTPFRCCTPPLRWRPVSAMGVLTCPTRNVPKDSKEWESVRLTPSRYSRLWVSASLN